MTPLEQLREARAKAIYTCWWAARWENASPATQEDYRRVACAIEAADAAMGVVSAPKQCDVGMAQAGEAAAVEGEDIDGIINNAIAASPYKEAADDAG